jgi:hypothetical protein
MVEGGGVVDVAAQYKNWLVINPIPKRNIYYKNLKYGFHSDNKGKH